MINRIQSVTSWLGAGAITGLLALLGTRQADFQILLSLVWAVPIIYIIVRYGLYQGINALLVTGIILGLATSPLNGAVIMLEIASLAIVIGLLYKNGVPSWRTMVISALVAAVFQLVALGMNSEQFNVNSLQLRQEFDRNMDQFIAAYRESGQLDKTFQEIPEQQLREMVFQTFITFIQLLPGIAVIIATLTALFNYRIAYRYLRYKGINVPEYLPFRLWRFPWYAIWGMILGLIGVILGEYNSLVGIAGKNILLVSSFFSLLMGSAVLNFYFSRSKMSGLLKGLLIGFIILNGIFSLVFILLIGLFDPILNFRRFNAKAE